MRLCTDPADPGYLNWRRFRKDGRKITIFLNGQEIKEVDLCDDIEGTVRRAVMSADGRPQLTEDREELLTETIHGSVRIEIGEPGSEPEHCWDRN
ncbi:hypothetical protein [Hyphomicrobium sp. DY-1]|uniref:hypothetical protein n=1 Tax=Hyphomicrobium sp. DY-1 TaxID=3075650 RepID=UPI0039C35ABA